MEITQKTREDMIREIREAGESLIKNAESIVGTETYMCYIEVRFAVDSCCDSLPDIKIEKSFYPEQTFERYWKK